MCITLDNQPKIRTKISYTSASRPAPTFNSISTPAASTSTAAGTHFEPMDFSKVSDTCSPITLKVKKYYRKNNLCLYCRRSGHFTSTCLHKRPRPMIAAPASTTPAPTSMATTPTLTTSTKGPQALYETKN